MGTTLGDKEFKKSLEESEGVNWRSSQSTTTYVRATEYAIRHITLSLVITSPSGSLLFYLYNIHFIDSIQIQFRFSL
ncbi:hypothetical protein ACN38_g4000 [Penicillium nordicum]|uniref:Uncharacterized protein n=1 Tax=Penicillium nordicum TaxID=229535 RepID=A0A0N0RZ98_9EURO|nr:hypothetical protein ACN38_g4000 [Penicillium nordicum]